MTEYVVGFLFCEESVVLIQKTRPNWQKGRLNGVGGHIEQFEFPREAMIREFEEETGVRIDEWEMFCTLTAYDESWRVYFFSAETEGLLELQHKTDEIPQWIPVVSIPHLGGMIIDNLRWLIPMAAAKTPVMASVQENT